MKVLWLTNVQTHRVNEIISKEKKDFFGGGWLDGLSDKLLEHTEFNLHLLFPLYTSDKPMTGSEDNFSFYGFPANGKKLRLGSDNIKDYIQFFTSIIEKLNPDVIHIHGSEFQYCYAMCVAAEKCNLLDKVVISIQGLVSVYAEHMYANIPNLVIYKYTIKELLTKNNVYSTYKAYKKRGRFEIKSLEMVSHVMGRTEWDKACTKLINPECIYHFGNETLRKNFYSGEWQYENSKKHSIFASQGVLPLKGIHILIRAIALLKEKYPNISLRVAGQDITKGNLINGSTYGIYIRRLINKYELQNNVTFIGPQNAEQMKNELLNSNVFVSPSAIENSPNSLGEAMLLGVPCISSDVGGVTDMLNHKKEGFVYPFDAYYMLAHYIDEVFSMGKEVKSITEAAKAHAMKTHNPDANAENVMMMYSLLK